VVEVMVVLSEDLQSRSDGAHISANPNTSI
jgi:hypothetical protein